MGLKRDNDDICNKFLDPVSIDDTVDEVVLNESDMETEQRGVGYNLLQSNDEDESETDYLSNTEDSEEDGNVTPVNVIRDLLVQRREASLRRAASNILEPGEYPENPESPEEREEREAREFAMNMPAILESMSRVTQHLNDLAAAAVRRH